MIHGHWKAARRAWRGSILAYAQNRGGMRLYKRHLRWAAAAALRQEAANRWFAFLDQPGMEAFLWAQPRLIFRPFSQYLALGWSWAERVRVIQDTYRFLMERGGFLAKAMSQPGGAILAELDVERGQRACIRIMADPQFRKEGELGVFLELEGIPATVSGFALSLRQEADGRWVGLIGAIQGRRGGEEEVIKLATKALHGLRPRSLLILLAQELAAALGLSALLGVGNQLQVFRARMTNPFVPKRRILFDYDAYWAEAEAQAVGDGWFTLPMSTPRREPEEVKPNKRSQYAKRYLMLDELSRRIRERLVAE